MKDISLHSLFLAQIMGLYMIIMPIILIQRRDLYRNILRGVEKSSLTLMMGGTFWLIVGLILVDLHNIWEWRPLVVITIVSWIILIKSILWLSMPEKMLAWCKKISQSSWFYLHMGITALLGVFMIAKGFFLFWPFAHPFY